MPAIASLAFPLAERQDARRPVDLVHLARATFGDRALEREVLQLFQRQSTMLVERLRRGTQSAACREAAHAITGAARGIGAWGVARAAEDAERAVGEGPGPHKQALSELEFEVSAANAYIADILCSD